ncbi:MAG: methyltransferase, partial [Candidatus Altarchaeum sp. CG_4_9_14_0_8_um_filter_32_206]
MKKCRVCKSKDLKLFLSLGRTPLANSFLEEDQLKLPEEFYPLNVCFCESCGFVQLAEVVPAEKMFKNYIYVTSTSEEARNHYKLLVEDAMNKFKLPENSLVVEFASNDGTLLKNFRKFNVRVLGVEPAENIAPIAEAAGIETINDFFNRKVAKNIVDSKGKASMIIGTNVFAHIDNLDEIMKSFQILLDDEGVII